MDLRMVIDNLGLSQIALSRQSNVSRFKLYQFINGDVALSPAEEKALIAALSEQAVKAQQAIDVLRQVASA